MTIRVRNRITFTLLIASIFILLLALAATSYQFITGTFYAPDTYLRGTFTGLWTSYNEKCVIANIFILMLYSCLTLLGIFLSFEKTQATDILYFLLFIVACLTDSFRILVPILHINITYSEALLRLGNITIFSRVLVPLSFLGLTVFSSEEFRQNTDRNCAIFIIVAFFFAELLPLNTAVILPNFSISYGYIKLIRYLSFTITMLCTFSLYLTNKKNEYKQIMTFGFLMMAFGYSIMFFCYNLLGIITGPILLIGGTVIYLSQLHKHYLWLD